MMDNTSCSGPTDCRKWRRRRSSGPERGPLFLRLIHQRRRIDVLGSSLPVGFGLVDADCCLLAAVVRNGDVEPPQLTNEQRRTSPFTGGDLAERLVMVGILLRKDPDGTSPARDVDALGLGVVEDVVRVSDGAEVGHRLSRLGIEYQQPGGASGADEQTVVGLVEGHGEVLRSALYGPSCDHGTLLAVYDLDRS